MQRNWNTTHWAALRGGPAQMLSCPRGARLGLSLSLSAIGPKVFTAPNTPGTCPRAVLKKKQKFNIIMMCQSTQSQMLCEILNWNTYPLGKLFSKWTTKENFPPRNTVRDSTPRLGVLPSWDLRPENSRAASPGHRASRASHLTHSPAQVAWEPTIFQTQLGLDLQINSREAWEGLLHLRSQVPGSPDGSLEALITGTLSELLLPQLMTWASFQGPW